MGISWVWVWFKEKTGHEVRNAREDSRGRSYGQGGDGGGVRERWTRVRGGEVNQCDDGRAHDLEVTTATEARGDRVDGTGGGEKRGDGIVFVDGFRDGLLHSRCDLIYCGSAG